MTGRVDGRDSVQALGVFSAIGANTALHKALAVPVVEAVGWVAAERVGVAIGADAIVAVLALAVVGAELAVAAEAASSTRTG